MALGAYPPQALNETVAEIFGQIEPVATQQRAIGFGQFGVAFGIHAVGVTIVNDVVGFECPAFVINPRVAFGRNKVFFRIVAKFVRLDEHFRGSVLSLFRIRGQRPFAPAAGQAPAINAAPDKANASARESLTKRRARRMGAIAPAGQRRRPINRPPGAARRMRRAGSRRRPATMRRRTG